ncbi:hypothetical protein CPLU01_06572 [Colletotrichum plurivorum]|uniref:Uncharacterized protein n=1 Tax=Colletotrichum plurivorum TaxID=2175906 RepID=A0A8H6NFM1_9PEZI|nr:hypothetical protein CPLU01_06572 [Colletotrichum plurivorum]
MDDAVVFVERTQPQLLACLVQLSAFSDERPKAKNLESIFQDTDEGKDSGLKKLAPRRAETSGYLRYLDMSNPGPCVKERTMGPVYPVVTTQGRNSCQKGDKPGVDPRSRAKPAAGRGD